MALRFNVSEVGGVTILRLDGRIVIGEEAVLFNNTIKRLIVEEKKKIILNLEEIAFMDSAGHGVLAAAQHSAIRSGVAIKLCHIRPKVQDLLQISRVVTIFDTYSTESEALKSFGAGSLYCLCPACGDRCGPSSLRGSRWAPLTCSNSACGAGFTVDLSQTSGDLGPVTRLIFQTYLRESVEIDPGIPFKCVIWGRLDLFASSALRKCWGAIPCPRRVVFDFGLSTEISDAGRTALIDLLTRKEDGSKATVSLEGLAPQAIAAFPDRAPFHRQMVDAVKALGDISDTPRWLARIIEESRLPA